VLNFFPIPVSVECPSGDGRRTGWCTRRLQPI